MAGQEIRSVRRSGREASRRKGSSSSRQTASWSAMREMALEPIDARCRSMERRASTPRAPTTGAATAPSAATEAAPRTAGNATWRWSRPNQDRHLVTGVEVERHRQNCRPKIPSFAKFLHDPTIEATAWTAAAKITLAITTGGVEQLLRHDRRIALPAAGGVVGRRAGIAAARPMTGAPSDRRWPGPTRSADVRAQEGSSTVAFAK